MVFCPGIGVNPIAEEGEDILYLHTLMIITAMAFAPGFGGLIWYGDPDKGKEVFNNLNFQRETSSDSYGGTPTGTITPYKDATYGNVWRVHKPAPDKRAEIRGAEGFKQVVGETYYIGWRSRIDIPENFRGNATVFQWKSYPNSTQNYPFVMEYNGRVLEIRTYDANWMQNQNGKIKTIWKKSVKANTWFSMVLAIKLSRNSKEGYLEVYFNEEKQELLTGGTRVYHKTMDGDETAPKWGIYNGSVVGTTITHYVGDLRIASDLESAKPSSSVFPLSILGVQSESRLRNYSRNSEIIPMRTLFRENKNGKERFFGADGKLWKPPGSFYDFTHPED